MGKSLREFCAENGRDELLRQWDTEKNGGKTPDDVSSGSSAMAWWRCDKGHSFPMRIAFRTTREQGLPLTAAGRRVLAGLPTTLRPSRRTSPPSGTPRSTGS